MNAEKIIRVHRSPERDLNTRSTVMSEFRHFIATLVIVAAAAV